jgi:hypothetical protein
VRWNPADYLPWNDWGGTEHLEKKRAAREKYKERLQGWSNTETWGVWLDSDRITALNDATDAYAYAEDASDYWARVAALWAGYAETMSSIHPDQFDKIVKAVGASKEAAGSYRDNRNWAPYVKDVLPKAKDIPWWSWPAGGLALWILIRK